MQHKRINARLASHALKDRIHSIGHQNNAPQIQAACDVCVLPSLEREGLPKNVIEGMAYALPSIVTDSGGSPELIENGISGIIVPPKSAEKLAEAIYTLYQDKSLRINMGNAARKRIVEKFTPENTINQTYAVYQSLLSIDQRKP
jgi:glycosyltransferase involved in cell wall biosynthesis